MQVLKPISPEDKKILLTDSYYTALQRNSYLLEGIAEGRFSEFEIKKIKQNLEMQNFNFATISSVIYAPFLVRQLERGKYCIEIDEIKGSLVTGQQNLKNFVQLISLFNYIANHSAPRHLFEYNIYYETLYTLCTDELEVLDLFPLELQSVAVNDLTRVLKSFKYLQQQWITKIRGQYSHEAHGIKNLEVIFDRKRRNMNKQITKLMLGIDHMLRVNNRVQVFRFEFSYKAKQNQAKFQNAYTDIQEHKAKLLNYLRGRYQKSKVYFGYIWKINFDHEYNLSWHLIAFFSELVNAREVTNDIKYRWSQTITKEQGVADCFFHNGYAAEYCENYLIDYKYYGSGIVRKDNDHDRLRLSQACRYIALPQLYLTFNLTEQDRSCSILDKKIKNKMIFSTFY